MTGKTEAILIRLEPGRREKLKRRASLEQMTMQDFVEHLIDTAIVTKPAKRKYERRERRRYDDI